MKYSLVLRSSRIVLMVAALNLTACAVIVDSNVNSSLSGKSDDGDSTSPPDTYSGSGDLDSQDSLTKSSSAAAKFNEVSGKAKALPRDPGAPTVTGDKAIASSRNKVTTDFVVNRAGNFTFDIKLNVEDVELVHDGKAFISVRANMLNAQGQTLPPTVNSGLSSVDLEFRRDGQNPHQVIIGGDEDNPDHATAGNDYARTLSGPNGGIQLGVGTYRLELSLNIEVEAPVLVGPDGRKHEANVKKATATITLR